ncbi:MAG: hypothetical protein ACREAA_10465 [Candidatus Polarisedimenticolia bacterium]
MRRRAPACLLTCAALAAGAPAAAEEAWTWNASASWFLLPDDDNFVLPIVTARRDGLHLEARYNYEDRYTGSLFGGWTFEGGSTLEWEAIPMVGAVVGAIDGIAPGLTLTLSWKQVSLYSENEYVFVLADHTENFYYNWSELTWDPLDWLSAGVATQRTRVYETDRDIQRGLMVRFTWSRYSATGYWFNPGGDDHFGILSFAAEF